MVIWVPGHRSESGYLQRKMELKNRLVLAVIIFTAKGASADIYQDIGTLYVLSPLITTLQFQ